jgi:hypothetical protein
MFTKSLLLAFLAACGGTSNTEVTESPKEQPDNPDFQPPSAPPQENDYIFCCQDVDPKSQTGDGCVIIGEKQIDQCATVLACTEGFTKKDGKVYCT